MKTDRNTDDQAADDAQSEASSETPTRVRRGWRRWLVPAVLVAVLVASAGVTAWLYFFQYRPDQQINADARRVAVDVASQGTIAVLSYGPQTLDEDFATAKSHLTGDFLRYYTEFTERVVAPATKQNAVNTSASIVHAAVAEVNPGSAVVLVFVNQLTTSKENPNGALAASSVKVGMTMVDGHWLINAFDPV